MDEQNLNSEWRRYSHNPPLVCGDTAGASDPYATSPYDGFFNTELIGEQARSGTSAELSSSLVAPRGTRNFAQHNSPDLDPSFSHQDSSFWNDSSFFTFIPESDLTTSDFAQMDQQSIQAIPPGIPADIEDQSLPVSLFADFQQMGSTDTLNPNPNHRLFNTQVAGISLPDQVNYGGNEDGGAIVEAQMIWRDYLDYQNTLDMSQVLQDNTRGPEAFNFGGLPPYNGGWANLNERVPHIGQSYQQGYQQGDTNMYQTIQSHEVSMATQIPSGPPVYDTEEAVWEDVTHSSPPSTNQHKLRERKRLRAKTSTAHYMPTKLKGIKLQRSQGQCAVLRFDSEARELGGASSITNAQTRTRNEDACFDCRINKKKCEPVKLDNRCRNCLRSGRNCMNMKYSFPMSSLSVSFTKIRWEQPTTPFNSTFKSQRIFRANIYVSFGSGKFGVPLRCKVSEIRSGCYRSPWSTAMEEDLPTVKLDKNCIQKDRLANYVIPDACQPSAKLLLDWAIESVKKLPSAVIEDYYGPLYTFAATYIRVTTRPLYDLVALTLVHTAIYNVGHSRMILVFDCKPLASHVLPIPLRDQLRILLLQIFNTTREEIRKKLSETRFRRRPEKERLALYVVLSLLILTYEHTLAETLMNPDCLASLDQDFESERAKFQQNLNDLRNLHESLFEKMPNPCHEGFDLCWKGDGNSKDDDELQEALSNLREAMATYHPQKLSEPSTVTQIPAPKLPLGLTSKRNDQESISDAVTVSTGKKLDLDNISASTGLDTGNKNSALSVQQIIEELRLMRLT